jgi:hypothetical protein
MHAFNTPVILFIAIVVGYLAISLTLGARKVYFEPLTTKPEDPEGASNTSGTESGASANAAAPTTSPPSESGSQSGS